MTEIDLEYILKKEREIIIKGNTLDTIKANLVAVEHLDHILRKMFDRWHDQHCGKQVFNPWITHSLLGCSDYNTYPAEDSGLLLRESGLSHWPVDDLVYEHNKRYYRPWLQKYSAPCFCLDDLKGFEYPLVMFHVAGILSGADTQQEIKSVRERFLMFLIDAYIELYYRNNNDDYDYGYITVEVNIDDFRSIERDIKVALGELIFSRIRIKAISDTSACKLKNYPAGDSLAVYIKGLKIADFVIFHIESANMHILNVEICVETLASIVLRGGGKYVFDKCIHRKYSILQAIAKLVLNGDKVGEEGRGLVLRNLIKTMHRHIPDPVEIRKVLSSLEEYAERRTRIYEAIMAEYSKIKAD